MKLGPATRYTLQYMYGDLFHCCKNEIKLAIELRQYSKIALPRINTYCNQLIMSQDISVPFPVVVCKAIEVACAFSSVR